MRFLWLLAPLALFSLDYEVRFIGLGDEAALSALLESSQLVSLQNHPPASINGLHYRAAADIPILIRTLHAFAYYEAEVSSAIEMKGEIARVDLTIQPGPQYKLGSYEVYSGACKTLAKIDGCCPFTPGLVGLQIGDPALSVSIVNAELGLLTELARCGYPLASVDKRRVIVDMGEKEVEASSCIKEGPLARFGPTSYFGVEKIKPEFLEQKIGWHEGCVYDADQIEETQKRLLKTELFSSVYISHAESLNDEGELPIKVRVTEARHRQISIWASYATIDGPGGGFSWTHRNVRGMGEIVSIKGEILKKSWSGQLTYKKPDFLTFNQTLKGVALATHENIYPYRSLLYRGGIFIDKELGKQFYSFGVKVDRVLVNDSASNGHYLLIGLPIYASLNEAGDLVDPKQGYTISYSVTPYQSLSHASERFAKQKLIATAYIPFIPSKRILLALRAQLGSIAGAHRQDIPLPKMFLGGSEDDLRGYKYKTVSPLDAQNKPLGGRSAVFTSVELRFRPVEKIGVVPFADFGTVSLREIPTFDTKWYKSIGIGVRYFAFFGPLRFDLGFPLDRRKGIDSFVQLYASVGQTF